ncbi:MAG TPA: amino acid permease [Vicinamibacterales bacterium]|nr:amino acid permease [Vicinamibacterales bacterium]
MTAPGRDIGFWTAVALVVGNMIGSGVFMLPASLAPYGSMSLAGWAVSAGGSVALALVFAHLARAQPAAGGPYAYTRAAFGDLTGFLTGWGYWISVWSALAALAIAFVGYLGPFVPSLVQHKTSAAALAVAAIWVVAFINLRGVRSAGRVQVVTTVLKTLPLVFIGLIGLAHFSPSALQGTASNTPAAANVMTVVTLTLWAFLGLESATIPAGAVRDAHRVIPRATILGTVIAAGVYVVSTVGVMSLVPSATLATSTAPFADAAQRIAGAPAAAIIALGAAVSCLGALNGWTLMVGQLPMAMASDGLFPAFFARRSARGIPATGIVTGALLGTTLVVVDWIQWWMAGGEGRDLVTLFTQVILLSTLSTLVPYFFCSLSVVLGLGAAAPSARGRTSHGIRLVACAAWLYALVAIVGAGTEVLIGGLALLAAGVPVYFWMARRRVRPPSA